MQLKHFDGLSKADQDVYFKIQVNPTDRSGSKRYTGIDDYRATLGTQDINWALTWKRRLPYNTGQ